MFEEIMSRNFPEPRKDLKPQILEIACFHYPQSRDLIVKLQNTKDQERNLQSNQTENDYLQKNNYINRVN